AGFASRSPTCRRWSCATPGRCSIRPLWTACSIPSTAAAATGPTADTPAWACPLCARSPPPTAAAPAPAPAPAAGWTSPCSCLEQRLVRVRERLRVDLRAGADQRLDRVDHVPDVDVHAGQHPVLLEPEGDELAGGRVAAEHDLVVAAG